MVHVFPYMDFNPGQPVDVLAASNGYEVELFLGERSMGRQILKAKEGRRLCGHWHFSYTGEEVHAIAFNEEGKEIARDSRYPFSEGTALRIRPERDFLLADGEDVGFFVIRCFDEQGRAVENANACVQITCDGAAFAVGTDNGDSTDEGEYKSLKRRLFSGKLLFAAKAGTTPGDFRVTVAAPGLREASVVIPVLPAHVREGVAVEAHLVQEAPASPLYREVRAIRLKSKNGTLLTRENPETLVEAFLLPPQARDRRLLWALTDVRGIPAAMASLEEGENSVLVRALSDGEGKIRCMSKSGSDAVRLISELPLKVEGFGSRAKNPFAYIHAGVYDMGEGEIGNGNERGVATSRHGRTCIGFRDIDFGKRGARKFDMDIFALTGDPYEILVYDGMPEEGGKRLGKFVYQKPSIWNTYQGESFILEKPLRGIKTLVFVLFDKVHIRGFRFEKPDKPLLRFEAGECDRIYGDSFRREADAVLSIGNNVTLEFCGIETEGEGTRELLLRGQTPLENNTVHVKIRSAQGEEHHILEFGGGSGLQTFPLLIPAGTYDFLFIFLPGSRFDFYGFALQ